MGAGESGCWDLKIMGKHTFSWLLASCLLNVPPPFHLYLLLFKSNTICFLKNALWVTHKRKLSSITLTYFSFLFFLNFFICYLDIGLLGWGFILWVWWLDFPLFLKCLPNVWHLTVSSGQSVPPVGFFFALFLNYSHSNREEKRKQNKTKQNSNNFFKTLSRKLGCKTTKSGRVSKQGRT